MAGLGRSIPLSPCVLWLGRSSQPSGGAISSFTWFVIGLIKLQTLLSSRLHWAVQEGSSTQTNWIGRARAVVVSISTPGAFEIRGPSDEKMDSC